MSETLNKITRDIWHGLGTSWTEFSEEERAKFEKGWSLLYTTFEDLFNLVLQHEGSFSFLTAKPIIVTSGVYFTLYSTTPQALALLNFSEAPLEQNIPYNLVYTEYLEPLNGSSYITCSGLADFSNVMEEDEQELEVNEFYILLNSGLFPLTESYWKLDPLINEPYTDEESSFDPYDPKGSYAD